MCNVVQYNVRFLKVGLRLVSAIAALGRKFASVLLKHSVMEKLCELLLTQQMASTLKLLALRALDSLLNYPQGMEWFLGWSKVGRSEIQGISRVEDIVQVFIFEQARQPLLESELGKKSSTPFLEYPTVHEFKQKQLHIEPG